MRFHEIVEPASPTNRSQVARLSLVAVPAGVVTVSLFVAMQSLVEVDDFSPPELPVYELVEFEPIKIDPPTIIRDDSHDKLKPVKAPPRTPPLVNELEIVTLASVGYSGSTPANYGEADFKPILPKRVSAIPIRDIQPITPPVPIYPRRPAELGLEGECNVYLDVSMRGDPRNVRAECSHRLFESAARKAVQKVKFVPQIRDGLPVTVTGVVYPLEFRLEP